MQRYNPDYKTGLNYEQVNKRREEKLFNIDTTVKTKSIRSIIISNFFTLFNIMNFVLALLIFFVGAYKNLLFIIIVILNTLISTIQEIHSKRTIDKLSFLVRSLPYSCSRHPCNDRNTRARCLRIARTKTFSSYF